MRSLQEVRIKSQLLLSLLNFFLTHQQFLFDSLLLEHFLDFLLNYWVCRVLKTTAAAAKHVAIVEQEPQGDDQRDPDHDKQSKAHGIMALNFLSHKRVLVLSRLQDTQQELALLFY